MAVPLAMEGLNSTSVPPFLNKIYDLLEDSNTSDIVGWSKGNNSFIVWDQEKLCIQLLPKYFKHNNLSSFIRQLNTYGFRKVDPDKLEFANECFLRGQRHLLKNIKRRKTHSNPSTSHQHFDPCVEEGKFGSLDSEIECMKRDKQVLMVELLKLKQDQQSTKAHLKAMEHRLKLTEKKQKQVMRFLAKAMQNSGFVQQLVQLESRKELVEAIGNKRRKAIDQGGVSDAEVKQFGENYVTVECGKDCGDITGFEEEKEDGLNKGFWENLLSNGIEEDLGFVGVVEEEQVDMLGEQLGLLDASQR